MKLSWLGWYSILALRSVVGTESENVEAAAYDNDSVSENAQDSKNNIQTLGEFGLNVSYKVVPDREHSKYQAGETIRIDYTLTLEEDSEPVALIGFAGDIVKYPTAEHHGNLTAVRAGPADVMPGGSAVVSQQIQLTLPQGYFVLRPALFMKREEKVWIANPMPLILDMQAETVSFFDPRFLVLQVILLGGAFFLARRVWRRKTRTIETKVEVKKEDWLPETHKKKTADIVQK